jgi:hypothetical protein
MNTAARRFMKKPRVAGLFAVRRGSVITRFTPKLVVDKRHATDDLGLSGWKDTLQAPCILAGQQRSDADDPAFDGIDDRRQPITSAEALRTRCGPCRLHKAQNRVDTVSACVV